MLVPSIKIQASDNPENIKSALNVVAEHKIDCVNWPELFPDKPKVSFKIAHNGSHLFLCYFVEEHEILAKTDKDNGSVWKDSCVEFFISFGDSPYYYNLEISCIGKVLFGYRAERKDVSYASPEIMSSIKRYPSIGCDVFDKKQGDFKWDLLITMPVSAYWQTKLNSFDEISAQANFYKCGDNLTTPHYISYNPILTKEPDFHTPLYLKKIKFE